MRIATVLLKVAFEAWVFILRLFIDRVAFGLKVRPALC